MTYFVTPIPPTYPAPPSFAKINNRSFVQKQNNLQKSDKL